MDREKVETLKAEMLKSSRSLRLCVWPSPLFQLSAFQRFRVFVLASVSIRVYPWLNSVIQGHVEM